MKYLAFIALIAILVLSGCAAAEPIENCIEPGNADGFFYGVIQGFIAPITFIVSIFDDEVAIYAVNNSGWLYDLGFLLGIGGFSGGVLKGRRRSRRD